MILYYYTPPLFDGRGAIKTNLKQKHLSQHSSYGIHPVALLFFSDHYVLLVSTFIKRRVKKGTTMMD